MSAILVLILRILMAAALYGFIGYALYTIWIELHLHSELATKKKTPEITISSVDPELGISEKFTSFEIILGRDPDCTLMVADDTVSARHAKLSYHHKQWWVEDLRSTNGTYINDEKVNTPTVMVPGDEIRCGRIQMLVVFASDDHD